MFIIEIDQYINSLYKTDYGIASFKFSDFYEYFVLKYEYKTNLLSRSDLIEGLQSIFNYDYFSKYIRVEKLTDDDFLYYLKKL